MIETEARVVALDADGRHAWVEAKPHGSCGNCDPVSGCRSVSISRLFCRNRPQRFRVGNALAAREGELVIVAVHERALLNSALLMYLLPVLALFAGAVAGALVSEPVSIAAGAAAFLLSLLMIRRHTRNYSQHPDYQPAIVRKTDGPRVISMEKA